MSRTSFTSRPLGRLIDLWLPVQCLGRTVSAAAAGEGDLSAALLGGSLVDRAEPGPTVDRRQAMPWRGLRSGARLYVGAVAVLGGLAIASSMSHITEGDAPLFATLVMLSFITSFAKVNLPAPRSASTLTVCYVIDFTTLLLLGRPAATLTAAVGAWSQCTFRCRRQDPAYQMWFSVGALALTVQATGFTYAWIVGHPGLPPSMLPAGAWLAAATVFFLANSFLVAGAVGLSTGQSTLRVWRTSYLWIWPGHVLGFGLAVVAAAGIGRSNWWLLPFAAASLAVTYGSFKGYVARVSDSMIDPLTDLPNRRYLLSHIAPELARADRERMPLAVLLIDLDGFKSINDTYGHGAGDLTLRQVAQCLQRSIRPYDICARYGGDEFVVVLPGCDAETGGRKASALQVAVAALHGEPTSGVTTPLRISTGLATYPADGTTFDQLVAAADTRMFEDKEAHRAARGLTSRAAHAAATAVSQTVERPRRDELLHVQRLAAVHQLTAGVVHDFNNALTAILGYGDLLTMQIGPDKPLGRDLREIVGGAQHAAALTKHLLAFSRTRDEATTAVDRTHCKSHGPSQGAPEPPPHVAVPMLVGTELILLVEDDDHVRRFATAALARHGYQVLTAPTAEAALRRLQHLQRPVDLLLTDIVLPGMDGRALAAQITSDRPHTRVLFTTGHVDRGHSADGSNSSVGHLLEKPFTATELLTRTRALLGSQ